MEGLGMKIKTKKQLSLPQLIEWIEINRRFNEEFASHRYNYVHSNVDGVLEFTGEFCEDTFTVEVEKEIDEDTEIKGLVEFGNDGYGPHFFQCSGSSINEQKDFDSEAFYIMNDDKTMTLIWKNGKMVE